jgi:hemoglobin
MPHAPHPVLLPVIAMRLLRTFRPLAALLLAASLCAPPARAAEPLPEAAGLAEAAGPEDAAPPEHPARAAPAPATDDRLYRALGGEDGVARITEAFIANVQADPRTRPYFAQASVPRLRAKLAEHFCAQAGGPCRYTGSSMKNVHSNLQIDRAAFNAVVENLQDAMRGNGVPFASQNALLARLAPLHREIETR